MRVRLLGPVDVTVAGMMRPISGLRRKGVLAVLALHAGSVVSIDQMVHAIWDKHPPATALNTLQKHPYLSVSARPYAPAGTASGRRLAERAEIPGSPLPGPRDKPQLS